MTPREANNAFLAMMARESGLPAMPPVTVRVRGDDGDYRLAAILDRADDMVKVREFAGGRVRWINRLEIVEAA